jgi:hypothetical protein
LRTSSPWDREQCLQDVWEWACRRGDLLSLQIIRDLPGVRQRERANLPASPRLVFK